MSTVKQVTSTLPHALMEAVFIETPSDLQISLVPRLSPQKRGGGESLVTSAEKAVDLRRLGLAVPIRLQNKITFSRDIFEGGASAHCVRLVNTATCAACYDNSR